LGALLYVYAGLPEQVVVQDDPDARISIGKEAFFYLAMGLMALTNLTVYIIAKVFRKSEDLRTWFYGLVMTLNVFFIIGMNYISLYNSDEKFDFDRIAFIIYGSLGLIILWAVTWPAYQVFKRMRIKLLV
jgi:hypothetical protein